MASDESWRTPETQDGWRLDRAVAARESVGARRRSREVVESGKVSVEGVRCANPGHRVTAGDTVSIEWNRPGTGRSHRLARAAVAGAGVTILHEDAHVLAVDKPPGVLTDSATRKQTRAGDTLTDRLGRYLHAQDKRAIAAHRIDRDTSGVVLFAKDGGTFDALRTQFHARTPERIYLAVVDGRPTPREGVWVDWMAWDKDRLLQVVADEDTPGAVRAEARYRVDATVAGGRALVEVRLVSGRRNQIRLQAMLRGYPLAGERQYLPEDPSGQRRPRRAGIDRHALHAWRLAFDHPKSGARIRVESPVPADLRRLIDAR